MKKTLKWVLPTFLGIVPTLGMEQTDQEYLNQKGAIYSISRAFQDTTPNGQQRFIAAVDSTSPDGKSSQKDVVARFRGDWQMNDVAQSAQLVGEVFVFCNDEEVTKTHTSKPRKYEKSRETVVNLLGGKMVADTDLPLGVIVDVCLETVFKRPNDTEYPAKGLVTSQATAGVLHAGKEITTQEDIFSLPVDTEVNVYKTTLKTDESAPTGATVSAQTPPFAPISESDPIIYQIMLKQRTTSTDITYCYEHKDENFSRGFRKQFRHWWQTDRLTDLVTEVFKIVDGQQTVILSKSVPQTASIQSRDSGRTNHDQCPPRGQQGPDSKYRRV